MSMDEVVLCSRTAAGQQGDYEVTTEGDEDGRTLMIIAWPQAERTTSASPALLLYNSQASGYSAQYTRIVAPSSMHMPATRSPGTGSASDRGTAPHRCGE